MSIFTGSTKSKKKSLIKGKTYESVDEFHLTEDFKFNLEKKRVKSKVGPSKSKNRPPVKLMHVWNKGDHSLSLDDFETKEYELGRGTYGEVSICFSVRIHYFHYAFLIISQMIYRYIS